MPFVGRIGGGKGIFLLTPDQLNNFSGDYEGESYLPDRWICDESAGFDGADICGCKFSFDTSDLFCI